MAHANARLTHFGRLLLVQRITELGWPPAQAAEALGVSRATAYMWLGRYRAEGLAGQRPGELVHLDVKKLGRIPQGGGHRVHGRAKGRRGRGIGYDYLHSAVDDRSRVAFSQILGDETGRTAARFLVEAAGFFAEHGVQIQRVLTDNAKAYTTSVALLRPLLTWASP